MIHVADDMAQMQVGIFPEPDQIIPVFVLVILDSDPAVVVAVGGIVGKRQRALPVLQMNDPVNVVGSRIHEVAEYLFDGAVLPVPALHDDSGRQRCKHRLPGFG